MKFITLYLLAFTLLASPSKAAESDIRWHVVLAAVGNEQVVFDNFITDFGALIKESSRIASYTELHASIDERWKPSGMRELDTTLTALDPQENEGCLIYLTGHGGPTGLAMSADTPIGFVRVSRMQRMLTSCAGRTTVLIVSACYSGVYMFPGIARGERIVMTASAEDLTSFGCSNNNQYTFFDQCFLDAWKVNNKWGMLANEVKSCVRETERSGGFPASKPQFFFGPGLEGLEYVGSNVGGAE